MRTPALAAAALAAAAGPARPADRYAFGPDSRPKAGVPRGTVTRHRLEDSDVYPGTVRDFWVYVPAGHRRGGPPVAVMVFQDGGDWYRGPDGAFRVPTVFDNLIAAGDMPPAAGVFVDPGVVPRPAGNGAGRKNRSVEYDTLSPAYAKFLETELLPAAERAAGVRFRADPAARAIAGISSGGVCAFTAAWERPDLFGKVMSHVGSFTAIRGGDAYPGLIRKADKKPIRVFLQAGERDLDNRFGSWPLANRAMAAALRFRGYDYQFVMGDGGHDGTHGGAILPDSLRWLWRGWRADLPAAGTADRR